MNAATLLPHILLTLHAELETVQRGARASFAAATDPDSKAENKYDTRNLEASYIARGQARRVEELQESIAAYEQMKVDPPLPQNRISLGAVISLHGSGGEMIYFMGPAAGGTEILWEDREIMVITPASPLGSKLMGRTSGQSIEIQPGRPVLIRAIR